MACKAIPILQRNKDIPFGDVIWVDHDLPAAAEGQFLKIVKHQLNLFRSPVLVPCGSDLALLQLKAGKSTHSLQSIDNLGAI